MAQSKSSSSKSSRTKYTKPELREKIKEQLQASDKGGRKGQWSARKSQLLVQEYEKKGGGYVGGKGKPQKNLEKWTNEHWETKEGKARARHGGETERYLPADAWKKLTPAERGKTDAKKRAGSKQGKQYVSNTPAAKRARRSATKKGS